MTEEGYESFEDFVRRRSVALQRFAYLVTHDPDEARDCVQDALVGLLPRWDAVASSGGVEAYVHRSIVNASVSRWRKVRLTRPVADPPDEPGRGDDRIAAVDDADEAWRLCRELPPVQRAALVLRFYDDLPFADVARVLQCPEATARSHVFRALATLRARLGGERP